MSFSVASAAGSRKPGNDPEWHSLHIGNCRVDPDLNRVAGPAGETLLEPKTMAVLLYLADRPGRVVSADELVQSIWLGRPMGDNPVYRCISQLRRALGDDARHPTYIATVPKKGWRLIAPVVPAIEAAHAAPPAAAEVGSPAVPAAGAPPRRLLAWTVSALIVVAVVLGSMAVWRAFFDEATQVSTAARPTIAVLPFLHESGPVETGYLAGGYADALIHRLGAYPELRLVARNSSFAFEASGTDARQVARALDVEYVLQGHFSVRDDRVHVNAELVDAEGFRVWGGAFAHGTEGSFALPSELAAAVAGQLLGRVAVPSRPTFQPDFAAYQHYLIGREVMIRRPPDFLETARAQFDHAIARDPRFTEAYAERAIVSLFETDGPTGEQAMFAAARQDIDRALALDPDSALAHAAEGFYIFMQPSPDHAASEAALRRALERDPYLVNAWNWLSSALRAQGREEEADEVLAEAARIDPLAPTIGTNFALSMAAQGHYDEAEARLERLLEVPRPARMVESSLVWLRQETGRLPEALGAARSMVLRSVRKGEDPTKGLYYLARVYAMLGDFETARFWRSLSVSLASESGLVRLGWATEATGMPMDGFATGVEAFRQAMSAAGIRPEELSHESRADLAAQLALAGETRAALDLFIPILEGVKAVPVVGPGPGRGIHHALAWAWIQEGEAESAHALLTTIDRAQRRADEAGRLHLASALYEYALNSLLLGDTGRALDLLERAERAGWRGFYDVARDRRWEPMRDDARFTELMTRIKSDLDAQRSLIDREMPSGEFLSQLGQYVDVGNLAEAIR